MAKKKEESVATALSDAIAEENAKELDNKKFVVDLSLIHI